MTDKIELYGIEDLVVDDFSDYEDEAIPTVDLDELVESVGRQVQDFAQRIEDEQITDIQELNSFSKLCNTYNRLRESAGQRRIKKETNGVDPDNLTDMEFLDSYYAGELDGWIQEFNDNGFGDPSHTRMLLIPDETWHRWEASRNKSRLFLPGGL